MITPVTKNYKGLITITGPTRSGKSQLAEFLIKEQQSVTYIATSKPRSNDPEWERRIKAHRERRPDCWALIEHPEDICKAIESVGTDQSILIDSLGGLVEHHLIKDDVQWELFQNNLIYSLTQKDLCIFVVSEEIGWATVPSTPIGHLFRERHCSLASLISRHSTNSWLAVNGTAINLNKIGYPIP